MQRPLVTILGKTVRHIAKLRGGGSALPGLVVERIDPNFIKQTLLKLPLGVVVISGTNGKTTTTKIVVELLESQGLKVFTNRTGSNFSRGVAAALLGEINIKGELNADIAVLELDEAHAVHFVDQIPPKYSLILNVMRDQLDRFGEIDKTANMLRHVANSTTNTVILNREDPQIASIARSLIKQKVRFFGLDRKLIAMFPSDDNLHSLKNHIKSNVYADVVLTKFIDNVAYFDIDGVNTKTKLQINGIYNIFNAAAAISLVKAIVGDNVNKDELAKTLSNIKPAFGRGEKIIINDRPLEIILVKNPSGFRLSLKSFDSSNHDVMIAINDNYADGRDMSWLWDVDFTSLSDSNIAMVSGTRAYDMALRLQYDDVIFNHVNTDIKKALNSFINTKSNKPRRIYCTYTAMLTIRKQLSRSAKMETVK